MIYTDVEITKEINELGLEEIQVFFVGILPSFIWDKKNKVVVPYHTSPNKDNELVVLDTELMKLETNLKDYLKKQEVTDDHILVFCINKQYFPPDVEKNRKGKWVRIKIL
jgi:hypothetical protein